MSPYGQLFRSYVADLTKAVEEETERLERIRSINRPQFKSDEAFEDWFGANFDPVPCQGRVIAVFRKYFLSCEQLNKQMEVTGKAFTEEDLETYEYQEGESFLDNPYIRNVNPKDFTVGWLTIENEELFHIINAMPYYPIGIDEDGEYC